MAWYTLFVATGYEHKIERTISLFWRIDGLKPFIPMYDTRFRRAGKIITAKKCLIPGYVFLEADVDGLDFYMLVRPLIARTEYALKLLKYGQDFSDESFELNDAECEFLKKILSDTRCVEMSQGYIEGNSIVVTEGPLVGLEGLIKRLNRHKMEATIETSIMGSVREVKIGLEIIKKLS